jgi:hypothetical protein
LALHTPVKSYDREAEKARHPQLKKEFGRKKKLPRGYGLHALIALSQYPELKDISIEFVFRETDAGAYCRPVFSTMMHSAKERTYRVVISKKIRKSKEPVRFYNLSFSAQIGVIAHELSHVSNFIEKSALEMAEIGIRYLEDNNFKRTLETGTDLHAIRHGFGYQLLEYAVLVEELQKQFPEESYYQTYFSFYMTPAEIIAAMREMGQETEI